MDNAELINIALADAPAYLAAKLPTAPTATQARALPTIREVIDVARDGTRIQTTMPGREDVRQSDRLPPGYKARSVGEMSFDPRLAYEIALDIDEPGETYRRYGYEEDAAVTLSNDPAFKRTVVAYKDEIKTSGIGFKLKAKIQAEDLLTHSYQIATDPEVPASVRADLIKWTAKVAGYEPKDDNAGGGKGGGSFALNVTFVGGAAPVTLSTVAQKSVAVIDQEGE